MAARGWEEDGIETWQAFKKLQNGHCYVCLKKEKTFKLILKELKKKHFQMIEMFLK